MCISIKILHRFLRSNKRLICGVVSEHLVAHLEELPGLSTILQHVQVFSCLEGEACHLKMEPNVGI